MIVKDGETKYQLRDSLEKYYGIEDNFENYQGVHHYNSINIKEASFDEEKEVYAVSFDYVSKTVTEDAYGMDLGGWNDRTEETHYTAQISKDYDVLFVDELEEREFEM